MSKKVEYKIVPEFPAYRVGSDGSVWSLWERGTRPSRLGREWRKLIGGIDKYGYRKVILCKTGKRKCVHVSNLILEVFVGKKPKEMECAHNNGNPRDDRLKNLRWDTHKNNIADKKKHNTNQEGEKHPRHKLSEIHVLEIREKYKQGQKIAQLATLYNITKSYAWAVANNKNWKCLWFSPACLNDGGLWE